MSPKIWLLYLILPGRFGHLLTGLLIFTAMFIVFSVADDVRSAFASGTLFFCVITAYLVPIFSYITRISEQAVEQLQGSLDMPNGLFLEFKRSISHKSLSWNIVITLLGLAGGFMHLSFIYAERGSSFAQEYAGPIDVMGDLGALIVWMTMTVAITGLLNNGIRIGRLAVLMRPINLFRTDRLLPFARVAISSCLSIVGTLALFPLLSFDQGASVWTVLPGLIATAIPMLAMLLLPMWPAHRILQARKAQEIALINETLDECRGGQELLQDPAALQQTNSLLDHRAHIQQISDWPIDIGGVSTLALYLIIPPLTWIGAALIENVVDAVL